MEKAIIAKNITKKYKLYNGTKERILDLVTPKNYGEDFYALRNVNLKVEEGDAVGFIGVNGSGKSTLSNILAGIVPETSGTVQINGQTALIAVSAGLKNDLTGRDNIELKCLMLGFSKEEIKEMEPDIIEFSELGKFIDQPVKSYSSGMKSRLGFAISVTVDPDILIIDEALSVGDKAFAEKSLDKMQEFKKNNKTMIFVSHSIGQMKQFCEKILWLEFGMVKAFGTVDEVIPKYEDFLARWKNMSKKERENYRASAMNRQSKVKNGEDNFQQGVGEQEQIPLLKDVYHEELTSRIGHVKAGKSFVYNSPKDPTESSVSDKYKNQVYYIKKQANLNEELFYLLSNKPSAQEGIIGWMKATDVKTYTHIAIENDSKTFYLNGEGSAYSRIWGGQKNLVYAELEPFKNDEFKVLKTEKAGNNIWYFGLLNERKVWIHSNHLYEKN